MKVKITSRRDYEHSKQSLIQYKAMYSLPKGGWPDTPMRDICVAVLNYEIKHSLWMNPKSLHMS